MNLFQALLDFLTIDTILARFLALAHPVLCQIKYTNLLVTAPSINSASHFNVSHCPKHIFRHSSYLRSLSETLWTTVFFEELISYAIGTKSCFTVIASPWFRQKPFTDRASKNVSLFAACFNYTIHIYSLQIIFVLITKILFLRIKTYVSFSTVILWFVTDGTLGHFNFSLSERANTLMFK